MGDYEIVDLTTDVTVRQESFANVDPQHLGAQLAQIRDAIVPVLGDGAAPGGMGLDSVELALTVGLEGKVWFVAKGSADASIKLTFKHRNASGGGGAASA